MTASEIIAIIIPAVLLLASIFGVYLKLRLDITKLEMRINAINREQLHKEILLLLSEKKCSDDPNEIITKIAGLIESYSKK